MDDSVSRVQPISLSLSQLSFEPLRLSLLVTTPHHCPSSLQQTSPLLLSTRVCCHVKGVAKSAAASTGAIGSDVVASSGKDHSMPAAAPSTVPGMAISSTNGAALPSCGAQQWTLPTTSGSDGGLLSFGVLPYVFLDFIFDMWMLILFLNVDSVFFVVDRSQG